MRQRGFLVNSSIDIDTDFFFIVLLVVSFFFACFINIKIHGFTGSYGYEAQDAKQFADWGFDFLKYDWCSYAKLENAAQMLQKPYRLMGSLLKAQKRDIVFNLCQYGRGEVWKWGAEVDLWRQKDLGSFKRGYEAEVPSRGVLLLRIRQVKS
ncbi:hypothetical protein [Pedobacter sp. BS3]|uniref:hypothetical protein n=1 Tax=Pedobacter sp. BS3 TaxID=2567937 RepID=UPI00293940C3|nr:hypothetical protein [Pedobacter sp. BS3]